MGASYNLIAIPAMNPSNAIAALDGALRHLGFCVSDHCDLTTFLTKRDQSNQTILVDGSLGSRWQSISSWGEVLAATPAQWYRENPLAMALSRDVDSAVYLFSDDSGFVAGYSFFKRGKQTEGAIACADSHASLAEFSALAPPTTHPSALSRLLGETEWMFEDFMRSHPNLEIAIASLAKRMGLPVHLLDPLDAMDGEGGLVVNNGTYERANLNSWIAATYCAIR